MKIDSLKNLTDHDLLLVIYTRQEELMKQFTNHLHHHDLYVKLALSAGLIGMINFTVGLMIILIKFGLFG